MEFVEELERLNNLRESGALSEEQYEQAKATLLNKNRPTGDKISETVDNVIGDESNYLVLLHLSQFCGYVFPLGGIAVPIVMWVIKKDESSTIDAHGRHILNWTISFYIYMAIAFMLSFILIGIPMAIVLGILAIIYPIIGAIKAKDGILWRYPGTMNFI